MGHNKLLVSVDAAALARHNRVGERAKKKKLAEEKETLRRSKKFAREKDEAEEQARLAQRE